MISRPASAPAIFFPTSNPKPTSFRNAAPSRTSAASSWGTFGTPESRIILRPAPTPRHSGTQRPRREVTESSRSSFKNANVRSGPMQNVSVSNPSKGYSRKAWIPGPRVLTHASRNDRKFGSSGENACLSGGTKQRQGLESRTQHNDILCHSGVALQRRGPGIQNKPN